MTTSFIKLAAAAAISLCATIAMAQTPAPKPAMAPKPAAPAATMAAPAATPAPAATMAPAGKPRTAKSIACSKEAEAQGIHGKKRHKFMSACKKGKTPM
jgi:hypothetical protein